MPAVGLDELNTVAALQHRCDRKYILTIDDARDLVLALRSRARVLEIDGVRSFRYESVYFDTPGLDLYLAAARSRPRRHKIRTRTYLDSGDCALEVKTRDARGRTVKHRRPHRADRRRTVTDHERAFLAGIVGGDATPGSLSPALVTRFERFTLLIATSSGRVTIDTGLRCALPDGGAAVGPDFVLVETKSDRGTTLIDRLLWSWHHRPAKISKYCVGLAALTPGLPANKWSRVLRRHFPPIAVSFSTGGDSSCKTP